MRSANDCATPAQRTPAALFVAATQPRHGGPPLGGFAGGGPYGPRHGGPPLGGFAGGGGLMGRGMADRPWAGGPSMATRAPTLNHLKSHHGGTKRRSSGEAMNFKKRKKCDS